MASYGSAGPPKYESVDRQEFRQGQQSQRWAVQQQQPQHSAYHVGYNQSPDVGQTPAVVVAMSTTVTNQPTGDTGLRTWSTSLCGCCEDMTSCCLVAWCAPFYLCCGLSPRMGESCCAPICLGLGGQSAALVYRTKLRAAHGIAGGAIDDCCVTTGCCALCSLCQMKREMDFIERTTGKPAFRRS